VVLGFVIAFAHRLYFVVELISGLAITFIVSYSVWFVSQNLMWTAVAFILFLLGTIASASVASMLAVVDGFLVSWLGIAAITVPSQGLSSEWIFTSAIMAAVLVGVAVGLGSLDFERLSIPLFASLRRRGRQGWSIQPGRQRAGLVCSTCGFMNRPGTRFCTRDGTSLIPMGIPKSNVCPNCGTTNRPKASYCRRCRTSL